MPGREILHVFAYDITSDRQRRRVAEALEDYGVRVQGSVFEVRVSRSQAQVLADRLSVELEKGDSLRVYALDASALEGSFVIGGPPIAERQSFWLI